ncbi:Cerato-platanin, partial [Schizopora paradoxa]
MLLGMKLAAIVPLLSAASVTLAQRDQFIASVTFDQTFDNPDGSLDTVACSNGANGLETLGFTTFGSLPAFPFIGGAPNVTGFDSVECGTCWGLQFDGVTINVLAIDVSSSFNIALAAMNTLTNGQAEALGRVTVNA